MQGDNTQIENERPERPVRNVFSQPPFTFLARSDVREGPVLSFCPDTVHNAQGAQQRNKRRLQWPSHRIKARILSSSPTIPTTSQHDAAAANPFPKGRVPLTATPDKAQSFQMTSPVWDSSSKVARCTWTASRILW